MQLSVRDVAKILNVPDHEVYRWVHEEGLPAREADGQQYFHSAQLLEWASVKKLPISPSVLREWAEQAPGSGTLAEAIREGGVTRVAAAGTKGDALRAVASLVPLPREQDRATLLDLLLAREAESSTSIVSGIAVPHPRQPLVLATTQPLVLVAYLDPPVDFGASDGKPVHTLLSLVSPTIRGHLAMLARIACVLREPSVRSLLEARSSAEELLAEIERVEAGYSARGTS